jgi:hypothetical protein
MDFGYVVNGHSFLSREAGKPRFVRGHALNQEFVSSLKFVQTMKCCIPICPVSAACGYSCGRRVRRIGGRLPVTAKSHAFWSFDDLSIGRALEILDNKQLNGLVISGPFLFPFCNCSCRCMMNGDV